MLLTCNRWEPGFNFSGETKQHEYIRAFPQSSKRMKGYGIKLNQDHFLPRFYCSVMKNDVKLTIMGKRFSTE